MATYYLSALASGSGNGLSAASPWSWAQFQTATFAANDRVNAKADGVYVSTAAKTINLSNFKFEGYSSVVGDGGQITIQCSVVDQAVLNFQGSGSEISNIYFDGNNLRQNNGVFFTSGSTTCRNLLTSGAS